MSTPTKYNYQQLGARANESGGDEEPGGPLTLSQQQLASAAAAQRRMAEEQRMQDIQVKREQKLLEVTPVGQLPCAAHAVLPRVAACGSSSRGQLAD